MKRNKKMRFRRKTKRRSRLYKIGRLAGLFVFCIFLFYYLFLFVFILFGFIVTLKLNFIGAFNPMCTTNDMDGMMSLALRVLGLVFAVPFSVIFYVFTEGDED